MTTFTGKLIGGEKLQAQLTAIALRANPEGRAQIAAKIGQRVAIDLMPGILSGNWRNWPSPSGYPRAYRAGGQALIDTGRLRSSWLYRADAAGVQIGTGVPYAHALDKGATIRPKKQWLLLPLSPPLSRSEVRDFPKGKTAIRARYPKSFFLLHGPEGPGIYRPSRVRTATLFMSKSKDGVWRRKAAPTAQYARKGRSIERIAAATKQVRIRAYRFAIWWAEWRPDLESLASRYILLGIASRTALVGGTLDVGAKK